jgi:hypothetical protein
MTPGYPPDLPAPDRPPASRAPAAQAAVPADRIALVDLLDRVLAGVKSAAH